LPKAVAKALIPCRSGQAQRAKNEAAALLAIGQHPHVVAFHGIFASKSSTGKCWMLVLGYCATGDLLGYLEKYGMLDSVLAKQLATSMLDALAHIHSREIMHRDVKPENVLINSTGCFILADYGEAVQISEGRLAKACGTPGYLAPEVLDRRPYNELVDLFSLGSMMHFCISGKRLLPGSSTKEVLRSNAKGKVDLDLHASKHLSAAGLEFLGKLLAKEPIERSSAQDALGHKWFNERNKEQAVTATEVTETCKASACEDDACSDTCYGHLSSGSDHIGHNFAYKMSLEVKPRATGAH